MEKSPFDVLAVINNNDDNDGNGRNATTTCVSQLAALPVVVHSLSAQ
jgi:hypothetical protein